MKKSVDIEKFEKRLGYTFKDPKYLLEALTHPSFSSTNRSDNQRLEFIGDRVLGLTVAEAIANRDTEAAVSFYRDHLDHVLKTTLNAMHKITENENE